MKKVKILSTIIWFFLLSACNNTPQEDVQIPLKKTMEIPEQYNISVDEEIKVELARQRIKEINNIRKGDYMMTKNNPQEALDFYLPVLEKLPEDVVLHKKVAQTYFLLKNWRKAYLHYIFVPLEDLSEDDKKNMILSLFYDEHFSDKIQEVQKLQLTPEAREYYMLLAECYAGVNHCVDMILTYQWTEHRIVNFQKTITDAEKISPDIQYRNLLLAKQLYEQEQYRLVGMITSEILANNKSYQEAIKMRAFALYEIGKYNESKDLLLSYFQRNTSDMEVIIRLGELYTFLWDYKTANLYFNNAILSGYKSKTLIERRLAYNYAKIGDLAGMQKVLSYLLQEQDVSEDDFSVAISLALSQGQNSRAYSWAYQWITQFPGSKMLIPLYVQTLRLSWRVSEARSFMTNLSDSILLLPMMQLERWILLFEEGKFSEAKKFFQELQWHDNEVDFAKEAKNYLDIIALKESQEEESWNSHAGDTASRSFWDF